MLPTVGLGEQTEFVTLVGGNGELCVECLQELPDEQCSDVRQCHTVDAILVEAAGTWASKRP